MGLLYFQSLEIKTHQSTMQIISLTTIFCSTLISSSLCGSHGYYKHQQQLQSAPQSIPEIVSTCSTFSTLLAALSAAGPFTVFAPDNNAFAKIPSDTLTSLLGDKDALTAVLARHVIAGSKILSGDIPQGVTKVQTLGGEEVEVLRRGSSVSIKSAAGSARVIKADVGATNGVIHVVDTVF